MSTSIATIVPAQQDGQPDTTISTADRVAAARRVYAEACANHLQARERADRSAALHQQAEADRRALVDKASRGEQVDQIDLTRARVGVAEAHDAADHARLVASGAGTLAEQAQIALLEAEAAHLMAGYNAALARQIERAETIDNAYRVIQRAVADYADAAIDLRLAINRIAGHNQTVASVATINKTLGRLPSSQHPKARGPASVAVPTVAVAYVTDRWGDVAVDPVESVAGQLRSRLGVPEPIPTPTLPSETWNDRQARIKTEADRMTGGGPTTFAATRLRR